MSTDQEDLLEQLRAGDRKAFEQLFIEYFKPLCSFSYSFIKDATLVEDMVQEVFVGYWERKTQFGHINAIKSFLYTSIRNKCLNHLKHSAVIRKHDKDLHYELESDQLFEHQVIEEDIFYQLHQQIDQLAPGSRGIMLLSLKGLKNNEIALELGISENTVKTQKKIAYAKIKNKLDPSAYAFLFFF